jgi:hypothetical protein
LDPIELDEALDETIDFLGIATGIKISIHSIYIGCNGERKCAFRFQNVKYKIENGTETEI